MRAVILANGWLSHTVELHPDDLLIAADGGALHCLKLGLKPNLVVGDFDSLTEAELTALQAAGAKLVQYPARKDYTDLELALQHVQELGIREVLILAALGDRWDQTIANLLLPATSPSLRISLENGKQSLFFLRGGEQLLLRGKPGDIVSLIPLAGDARGITTHNLEYPLYQESLTFGSTRGVSNVLLGDQATISLEEGLLLCTVIHLS